LASLWQLYAAVSAGPYPFSASTTIGMLA